MTGSPAAAGGKKTYNDRLKVLMDYTLLKASTVGILPIRSEKKGAWNVRDEETVEGVLLSGMAELQNYQACDECGAGLPAGHTVAGKVVFVGDSSVSRSFFWPTCIPCFVSDRGGYLSAAIVALVMRT